uniref:DUF2267 domain-containing protein n=1 Tax=Cyanothece sp. (strain PCC 7425 / ATCC 29141) TaxID=395961 RepID=B8HSV2_CYAP4
MTIALRDDIAYILLKKIDEASDGPNAENIHFTEADFAGREISIADLLGHLDYLNQRQFINAEFTGNAYGNQEDVPDAVDPEEFDFRVANTYGAPDGPLPHLITFKRAVLTEKGRQLLADMEANPPQAIDHGPTVPIATKDRPFLEKVMIKGNLTDPYDARDITEVVFRTMRDMMTTEASDRVADELHEPVLPTEEKALQNEVADLWQDTNPLVHFLSRIRPPLIIKPETFLRRIRQEAGLPPQTDVETVLTAVFSATKDELSQERIQEIAEFLPEQIRQLWQAA